MSHEEPLKRAERELEAALGALHPVSAAIDRDRMMFEAGRRSVPPQRRPIAWQALSGALAAALLVSISLHRHPREVERIVYVPATTTTTAAQQTPTTPAPPNLDAIAAPAIESTPPATSYLILRRHALDEDGSRGSTELHRPTQTRRPIESQSRTDLPTDAGFFGRAGTSTSNRL